jgi:hypothetical protein
MSGPCFRSFENILCIVAKRFLIIDLLNFEIVDQIGR